jgi:putative DNA primase/helicase
MDSSTSPRACTACGAQFRPPDAAPDATLCRSCYSARKVALKALPETVKGRWVEVLTSLGMDRDDLTDDHKPCPGCGGTDRFRFDDRDGRGTFVCGRGGDTLAGDGFALLAHAFDWTPRDAYLAVARWAGVPGLDGTATEPPPAPKAVEPPKPKRDLGPYARELWARVDREDSVVAGHPYAIAKGVDWACGAGRGLATGRKIGKEADCVIVPVRTPEGELCAVECLADHRDAAGKFVRQAFGDKRAGWLILGNDLDPTIPHYVVEGWATGARLAKTKRNCCIFVAFGSGRMLEVANEVERLAPGSDVTVWREVAHG